MRFPLAGVRSGTLLVLVATVLSGCSHATATSSTSPTSPRTSSSAASPTAPSPSPIPSSSAVAVQRCTTDELRAHSVPGSPGAGQRYATLVLTNTGARTCTVFGYGG